MGWAPTRCSLAEILLPRYWLAPPAPAEWHRQSVLGSLLGCNVFRDMLHPPVNTHRCISELNTVLLSEHYDRRADYAFRPMKWSPVSVLVG